MYLIATAGPVTGLPLPGTGRSVRHGRFGSRGSSRCCFCSGSRGFCRCCIGLRRCLLVCLLVLLLMGCLLCRCSRCISSCRCSHRIRSGRCSRRRSSGRRGHGISSNHRRRNGERSECKGSAQRSNFHWSHHLCPHYLKSNARSRSPAGRTVMQGDPALSIAATPTKPRFTA